jgi:OOP family OmpA-OmpF porin
MKKLLIAAACSAALIAGPAAAEMYLGAGVGAAKTDSHENSWKVFAGYQFNPSWAGELAYTDLRHYRGADIESWSLAAVGTQPLNENWDLLGKLGVASNRPHFPGARKHNDALLGVGLGYKLSKTMGLRLEYEDYGKLSDAGAGKDSRGSNLVLSLKSSF